MRALGIVLAGGNSFRMKKLSAKRAVSAMPVGGSYRSIDFVLSNMSNSNIQRVAVITQYNARSLHEHLSSSKWWDFGRKQGGLYIFTPTITNENSLWYQGTADSLVQNIEFLHNSHEPYVVLAGGDGIYKMDYNQLINYHIEKQADITVACTQMPEWDVNRFGVIRMNEDSRIVEFEEKPLVPKSATISAGIYVIRRRLLIELLEACSEEGRTDFVSDILIRYKDVKRIYGYKIKGYWSSIATVDAYFRTNMDFLQKEVRDYFFDMECPIYSKVEDLAPAKYNTGARVHNSLIASGCIINGAVEDSVIFNKVFIGKNCVINNSIILHGVYVGDNTHIENCIVESLGAIPANTYLAGEPGRIKIVTNNDD